MKAHRIHLSKTDKTLQNQQQKTLLEVLESHNISVEYQCREGYCGSCRIQINGGQVCYKKPPLACIDDNEILPCCCQIQSDIELEL